MKDWGKISALNYHIQNDHGSTSSLLAKTDLDKAIAEHDLLHERPLPETHSGIIRSPKLKDTPTYHEVHDKRVDLFHDRRREELIPRLPGMASEPASGYDKSVYVPKVTPKSSRTPKTGQQQLFKTGRNWRGAK